MQNVICHNIGHFARDCRSVEVDLEELRKKVIHHAGRQGHQALAKKTGFSIISHTIGRCTETGEVCMRSILFKGSNNIVSDHVIGCNNKAC